MKKLSAVALLCPFLILSACDSSSSSDSGATTTSGDSSATSGSTAGNTTDGDTTNGGTSAGTSTDGSGSTSSGLTGSGPDTATTLLDAGLSHSGTPIPSVAAIPNDPQILASGRSRAAALPNSPGVIFEVFTNQGTSFNIQCRAEHRAQYNACSVVNLHINDANGSLDDNAWKLYFHSTRRILQVASDEFTVTHVNGDLHYLSPNDQFAGFGGGVKSLKMITEFNHLVETDFQPRYWIARGNDAQLIANTDEETNENAYAMEITGDNRFEFVGEENPIATSSLRFDRNDNFNARLAASNSVDTARIIPMPSSLTVGSGSLDIGSGFSFASLDLPAASISALQTRQAQFMSTSAGVPLSASIDAGMAANTYTLNVTASGITMAASDQSMLFYAAQSLLALVQPGVGSIPLVSINDSPRFEFRGMHVDVARNFHSVDAMKKLIDQMAAYKLNKLHLHLSDDEGWRLEIPALPELTSVAGKRGFQTDENGNVTETDSLMPAMGSGPNTNNQGSGFYSRAQFIDLLQYANDRFIEVIPEFDMPAHARAAVVAMRARARNLGDSRNLNVRIDDPDDTSRYITVQNYTDSFINPCVPGTYNFLQTIIGEVKDMYTAANLPFNVWHMGGDEAVNIMLGFGFENPDTQNFDQPWAGSPVCAAFINDTAGVNSRDDLTPYFIKRVSQLVSDAGIPKLYAYQDIYGNLSANELNTTGAGVGFWAALANGNASNTIGSANSFSTRGFETVIGTPDFLYFDFPYEVDPKERGYYWAARQTNTEKVFKFTPENLAQNASISLERYGRPWTATNQGNNQGYAGMQGFLWSETVRTPEQFDYMLFPRLLALAERAWHAADWELPYVAGETFDSQSGQSNIDSINNDYATFAAAIGTRELLKLDAAGIQYRVPPPGAKVIGGQLQMNSHFPGLALEYSNDGNSWQSWNSANPPATAAFVRSKSADGSRISRVTEVQTGL